MSTTRHRPQKSVLAEAWQHSIAEALPRWRQCSDHLKAGRARESASRMWALAAAGHLPVIGMNSGMQHLESARLKDSRTPDAPRACPGVMMFVCLEEAAAGSA